MGFVCCAVSAWGMRYPLTLVLLLTITCWLPYFSNSVRPIHDSAYVYQCFHYFYNELFCNGEFARWGRTGLWDPGRHLSKRTSPNGLCLRPAGVIAAHQENACAGQSVDSGQRGVAGVWSLFARRELYRLRLTRLLITMGGVLSVSWLQQSFLNLGVFYLLPLTMYFLSVSSSPACRPSRPGRYGRVCSGPSGVPYFVPLKGLVLLVFAIPLCFQYPRAIRPC